jgi:hypothetical protein
MAAHLHHVRRLKPILGSQLLSAPVPREGPRPSRPSQARTPSAGQNVTQPGLAPRRIPAAWGVNWKDPVGYRRIWDHIKGAITKGTAQRQFRGGYVAHFYQITFEGIEEPLEVVVHQWGSRFFVKTAYFVIG